MRPPVVVKQFIGLLEGEHRSEFGTPISRGASWLTGNLGGAKAAVGWNSVAGVIALFKAELDPRVHLIEDGDGFDVSS